MKVLARTITRLREHINGDDKGCPYRSGPMLIRLFNEFGFDDVYEEGFPSRWTYTEDRLRGINGKPEMAKLIETVFDPLEYEGNDCDLNSALEDINKYLNRDGFIIVLDDGKAKVRTKSGGTVGFTTPETYKPTSDEFIKDHLKKCENKLRDGDNAGAITNARSLCEEVLVDIDRQLNPEIVKYDGDLPRLYKRVRKGLNLDQDGFKELDSVVQLLRGLTVVIDGLSGMSNKLADRHGGGGAKPDPHHAQLAVNAAHTLCSFVVASFIKQRKGN